MKANRHAALAALPYEARTLLHTLAVRDAVSVDDVVSAALGRAVPSAALAAGKEAALTFPALKALDWPYLCPRCGEDAPALGLCSGGCGVAVCNDCGAGGCDPCQRVAAARKARAIADAAERDARVKRNEEES